MSRRFFKESKSDYYNDYINNLRDYLYEYPIDGIEFSYDFYTRVVDLWVHFENKFPLYAWLHIGQLNLDVKPGNFQELLDKYSVSINSYQRDELNFYSVGRGYYLEIKNKYSNVQKYIDNTVVENFAYKIKPWIISKEGQDNSKKDISHFNVPLHDWPEENRKNLFDLLQERNDDFETQKTLTMYCDLEGIRQVNSANDFLTYSALCYLFSKSLYLILNNSDFEPTPENPEYILRDLKATKEKIKTLEEKYDISKLYWESKGL